ncbi:transmembrane protein 209 [Adelges cooleyi]|uniref:transmembrane protein 209 n=1 Tax=Adelges cooleyi TaxID=133065 RepID=UPI00217FC078|nr:transmembrane protein 209 [Adelges cooleyi]
MRTPTKYQQNNSTKKDLVKDAIQLTIAVNRMKQHFVWGAVNTVILSMLVYDLLVLPYSWYTPWWRLVESTTSAVLCTSLLYHIFGLLKLWMTTNTLDLAPEQFQTLGLSNSYIRIKSPHKLTSTITPPATTSTPINCTMSNWNTPRFQISPDKLVTDKQNRNGIKYNINNTNNETIEDMCTLEQYLKDYDSKNSFSFTERDSEQRSLSLWERSGCSNTSISSMLQNSIYQVASSPEQSKSDLNESTSTVAMASEVWRKFKVDNNKVERWLVNLRTWISQTIITRLVKEIENVDRALYNQGFVDVSIGNVGLERLKKTAHTVQVAQTIPSLLHIIPYFEISTNQEYVVQRIRELAKGPCLTEYRWNSGGTFKGKEWTSELPSDSVLVMHLLATYLDSQLSPLTRLKGKNPFSVQHLIKYPEKIKSNDKQVVIYQQSNNPPHYNLKIGKDTHNFPKGRNNFFYTILLFLNYIKTTENGMLESVNLGKSGVNMLWIVE